MKALPIMDWKNVAKWITACLEDRGVPMFRPTLLTADEPAVLGICWGGYNRVSSVRFINVPKEDINTIIAMTGEWKVFLNKYGTPEEKEKVKASPVVLPEELE